MKLSALLPIWFAFLMAIAILPSRAFASEPICHDFDYTDPDLFEWLHAFYVGLGPPILGAERRLRNGVAWRVVIDAGTHLAEARITWMPDRKAMEKANRFLEGAQACRILKYYQMATDSFGAAKEWLEKEGRPIVGIPDTGFLRTSPDLVELTYASNSLLSGYNVLADVQTGRLWPYKETYIWDLSENRLVGHEDCAAPAEPTLRLSSPFRLQGLLDLCKAEAHEKFLALWKSKFAMLAAAPAAKHDPGLRNCPEENLEEYPPARRWAFYALTDAGLAVHTTFDGYNALRGCILIKNTLNPVIIPYRELEPWLVPGPWRDELLKAR
ncbi:MAG TPA: hypothetical protein VFB13_02265 [Reyranella sp.]|nr:hypothetical protein [Reyranella sp.]